jgi:hypothetical protein
VGPVGPSGEQGPIGLSDTIIHSLQNGEGAPLSKLVPVYKINNTTIGRANDTQINKCVVFGLIYDDIISNDTVGSVCSNGTLEFEENVWLSYLGYPLVAGQTYYLNSNQVNILPDMNSVAVVKLGIGLSSTKFKLQIEQPIYL